MSRVLAVTAAALALTALSWLAPAAPPRDPGAPPAWFCPVGQHLIRMTAGLPECAR